MAESYRDRAIVVKRHDLGEADRIIVLFTRGHGIVRAVAKGVRRAKSRFGSRLAPFVDVDVQIHPGRNLGTITGADTVRTYAAPIVDDYARYTCACAVLETAERLAGEEGTPSEGLWDLTVASLAAMAGHDGAAERTPGLLLTSFLLKAMAEAGWAPSLFDCAQCGKSGPHRAFAPAAGGAVCVECRPPGAATPPTDVLRLMWWLAHDRWEAIAAVSDQRGFRPLASQARSLATAHLQWHLGRRVAALEFVDARWGEDGARAGG
ncbi:DNA repair protein RecO [uncultured Corynebacterium sp.]|uniref:DNA repair protein RecO n=1 Tax=uncultured Corynebacterium sp. TaxID=159447 RepID=UPI0025DE4757|nr:DNA repair protein RecO [uncultured Corynebacterium sp.]